MKLPTIALSSLLVVAACGKKDDGGKPKADDTRAKAPMGSGSAAAGSAAAPKNELPPPPADAAKGQTRVVNLWLGPDGKTQAVDVWAKRSFQYGPTRLAENVAYGQASPAFGIPTGMSTIVVPAGAGVEAKALGGLFPTKEGEAALGFLYNRDGVAVVSALPEKGGSDPIEPPAAGKGLVVLFAGPTGAFAKELAAAGKSDSFYIGDGTGACRKQRIEDKLGSDGKTPFQAMILGGTQRPELALDPGKHKITLHKWPGDGCKTPAIHEFEVEVAAGAAQWVFVHSPDRASLAVMTLPLSL